MISVLFTFRISFPLTAFLPPITECSTSHSSYLYMNDFMIIPSGSSFTLAGLPSDNSGFACPDPDLDAWKNERVDPDPQDINYFQELAEMQ